MDSDDKLQSLKGAYNPNSFRKDGKVLVDLLADYLEKATARSASIPVLDYQQPEDVLAHWTTIQENPSQDKDSWWKILIEESIHLHHPRYMGHQVCPPLPVAAMAGLLVDLLNNGMGVYEMGPVATAMEQSIIKLVSQKFGMSDSAGGFMTSGGTLANLTALLTARRVKAPTDVWNEGHTTNLAVMVSEQAHYCIDRAVKTMGFGADGIIKIPADQHFRMQTELLPEYWQQAIDQKLQPIAVVGSACTTSVGSFDDLESIAEFCQAKDLWFHVDGAHGAAAAFSEKYKPLVKGIEQADSVVMDFHKTMMTPALATALVYKNDSQAYSTFSHQAQYLWESAEREEWHELSKRTFECTKSMMSVKVFSILKTYGTEIFETHIDTCFDLGAKFAELINSHPQLKLATEPQCNIVCFRYVDDSLNLEQQNQLNASIRKAILEKGEFYIVQTQLGDKVYLRTTLTNPLTQTSDLESLLSEVTKLGVELDN